MDKVNPLNYLPGQSPNTPRKTPRPQVQGELSLDKVKVKCNDLSDSDLEIVPDKNVTKPDGKSGVAEMFSQVQSGQLSRMASRLLGQETQAQ